MVVQEEKERLKIKVKDLIAVIDLSKEGNKCEEICTVTNCQECDYPITTQDQQKDHALKHKTKLLPVDVDQTCSLCEEAFVSQKLFRNHIQVKNQTQYDCEECDFQGGSTKIILSKHMNLRHRETSQQSKDTHKCNECDNAYSAKWNLNNHKRDEHEIKEECSYYKHGDCRFPDKVCWKIHEKAVANTSSETASNAHECYICKNKFQSKNEMMLHRKEIHPKRVKNCKDPQNCSFKKCWCNHNEIVNSPQIENEPEKEVEIENQTEGNFQLVPELREPHLAPKN